MLIYGSTSLCVLSLPELPAWVVSSSHSDHECWRRRHDGWIGVELFSHISWVTSAGIEAICSPLSFLIQHVKLDGDYICIFSSY